MYPRTGASCSQCPCSGRASVVEPQQECSETALREENCQYELLSLHRSTLLSRLATKAEGFIHSLETRVLTLCAHLVYMLSLSQANRARIHLKEERTKRPWVAAKKKRLLTRESRYGSPQRSACWAAQCSPAQWSRCRSARLALFGSLESVHEGRGERCVSNVAGKEQYVRLVASCARGWGKKRVRCVAGKERYAWPVVLRARGERRKVGRCVREERATRVRTHGESASQATGALNQGRGKTEAATLYKEWGGGGLGDQVFTHRCK